MKPNNELIDLLDKDLDVKLQKAQTKIDATDKMRDTLKEEYAVLWKESAKRKSTKIKNNIKT
jgi:hypothetical protein